MLDGYGSSGKNMMALAERIMIDNVLYAAPNGVETHNDAYKWFEIGNLNNINLELIRKGVIDIRKHIYGVIDDLIKKHNVLYEDVIVFGFSQGAMMALDVVTQHKNVKYAIASSGMLHIMPGQMGENKEILLLHGKKDTLVMHQLSEGAKKHLNKLKANVQLELYNDLGHSINEAGTHAIKGFLQNLV